MNSTPALPRSRRRRALSLSVRITRIFIVLYFCLAFGAYLTNPFVRFTLVKDPFSSQLGNDLQLQLTQQNDLRIRSGRIVEALGFAKSAQHMVSNVYVGGKRSHSTELENIIHDIHQLRFNPAQPFLISGDHFSVLYIRSLGIFYHSLLDPRTALDETDWLNRQRIYLQTTAYALDVFAQSDILSTTIVPVGPRSVTLMNVYRAPSDSLYSLLYALSIMKGDPLLENIYPIPSKNVSYTLNTQTAAEALIQQYHDPLQRHLVNYLSYVLEPSTGLVKRNILLSGTKDVTKRQSAFYDNVILWRTQQLAQQLGLEPESPENLAELKTKILQNFWMPDQGCFLEDLSDEGKANRYYSSDWLIALMTGFLDPSNPDERPYFVECVKYIQRQELDQPFGLKYQQTPRANRQYLPVRLFAPSYGTTTIWSNWGMEYVKLLVRLYDTTGEQQYLETARKQLDSYTQNILTTRCYPEVYDLQGKLYRRPLYQSVCQTGWVVTYEEAKMMVESRP